MDEISIDKLLQNVDYGKDSSYVPSDFALEFVAFIKLINGEEGEENKTPVLHYRMLDLLAQGETRLANMLFRGASKTTVFGEYLCLYLAVYQQLPKRGTINLIMYVSDSMDNGVKNFRKNVEYRWENSDFLKIVLPEAKFTDGRLWFRNADGKQTVIKGYGALTGVRGTKELGKRPQVAILDDLISDDIARSDTEIKNIESTIYSAIDYALHPKNNLIIWSGTPFNAKDPLYKAIESGAWKSNVFPVCEKFPCNKSEFKGAWEDRFPYEVIRDKYEKALKGGKLASFYQELMLKITSDEQKLVNPDKIGWYSRRVLIENRSAYNFYITTDFAVSEKQHADYSVISVWAINSSGHLFLVDGVCRQQLMNATLDELFRLVSQYKPLSVGIEISGQQAGFIPWIHDQMLQRNIWFSLAKDSVKGEVGLRPKGGKLERFDIFLPTINAGLLHFPHEMKDTDYMDELLLELSLVTTEGFRSKHDDILDTLTMLPRMQMFAPTVEHVTRYNPLADIWELEADISVNFNSYIV